MISLLVLGGLSVIFLVAFGLLLADPNLGKGPDQ